MKQTNSVHEQVSALADGHLHGDEFAEVVGKLGGDDDLRAVWSTYHVVGDVLRSGGHSASSDTSLFLARLRTRLDVEPSAPAILAEIAPTRRRIEAANEPVFRWKLVAGAASLAAAAAIGWNWVGGVGPQPASVQLAQQQQQQQSSPSILAALNPPQQSVPTFAPTRVIVGNGGPQVMMRDPRLDQLLEAHQQAGGASQMPSGFLRNATFERPSR